MNRAIKVLINGFGMFFTAILLADITIELGFLNVLGYAVFFGISIGMITFKIEEGE